MFFDAHSLTDQELIDKTMEIQKRLAYAGRFSSDSRLIEQLQMMADACAFEARERSNIRMYEMLNKSQPDEKELTGVGKISTKRNSKVEAKSPKREGAFRVTRTTTPVKE